MNSREPGGSFCGGANIVLWVVLCPAAAALGRWLAALFGRA